MRKRRSHEEVELNMAAMLDMAFQLLTFFILTFKPPPAEGQIFMRMPPAQPVLNTGTVNAGQQEGDPNTVKPAKTLTITLVDEAGAISKVSVGIPGVGSNDIPYSELNTKLNEYFKNSADAFEQVVIQATPHLNWAEVMKVIEICSMQRYSDGSKLAKLSFNALPDQ